MRDRRACSFGTVLQCVKRLDGQVYAVKRSERPLTSESMLRYAAAWCIYPLGGKGVSTLFVVFAARYSRLLRWMILGIL
jgi:hypothetical protein